MARHRTGFGPVWGPVRIVVGILVVVWSLAPIYWGACATASGSRNCLQAAWGAPTSIS